MIDTHFACFYQINTHILSFGSSFFRALHHFHVPKWWKTLCVYCFREEKMPVEVDTILCYIFPLPNRLPTGMYEYNVETFGSSFRFEFSLSAAVAFCVDLFYFFSLPCVCCCCRAASWIHLCQRYSIVHEKHTYVRKLLSKYEQRLHLLTHMFAYFHYFYIFFLNQHHIPFSRAIEPGSVLGIRSHSLLVSIDDGKGKRYFWWNKGTYF